jgi:hypothetical protein
MMCGARRPRLAHESTGGDGGDGIVTRARETDEGPAGGGLPEIVVAPARPDIRPAHDGDVIFEVRELSGGGRALPVFTTVKRLVATLGPDQPWVALPLRNIQAIMGGAGVDRVVIDPQAQPGAWRWQASDLQALERRQ